MAVADLGSRRDLPGSLRSNVRHAVTAVDPWRIGGVALFIGFWQLMTLALPPIILPTPLGVVERVGADFWSAPSLSFYGVSEANLYGNMLYTAENVGIAVVIGSLAGILSGLLSARFVVIRAL